MGGGELGVGVERVVHKYSRGHVSNQKNVQEGNFMSVLKYIEADPWLEAEPLGGASNCRGQTT